MSNPLTDLVSQGQSPWIDFIRRTFIASGEFGTLISAGEIRGATSNPTIFEKAIGGSSDYDDQMRALVQSGVTDPAKIFDELAIQDIQMAAGALRGVYDQTSGQDGYISLEVSPEAANNTALTLTEARRLWGRVNRPNVMIKVPATAEGLPAIETLLGEGINVNITLLFDLGIYEQVARAYLKAITRRVQAGQPVDRIASVASFFVSRVDTEVDKRLSTLIAGTADPARQQQLSALQGKAAIANAKLAYQIFTRLFHGPEFAPLQSQGAHVQRLLWASTSTKNPAYRDVIYVEELIGPETVNTMPPATIEAFRDHGRVRPALLEDVAGAEQTMRDLAAAGVNINDVTYLLQVEGIQLFAGFFTTC